jgi:cellulose biosynthesis protein BcsQ
MNTVASYSIKGGVGKTALAVNLAYACAQAGKRTLLLDLDPQGASSFYFRVSPKAKMKGRKVVAGKQDLLALVRESDYPGLDILPAKLSFRHFDLALADSSKPTRHLRALLKPLRDEYDLVVLDSPPNITLLSENVLDAADAIVTPVVPTCLSVNTLEQLSEFIGKRPAKRMPRLLPFFSMVERRKKLHRETMADLRRQFPETLLAIIPYSTDVERMGVTRAPLLATRPSCRAGKAFAALALEVLDIVSPESHTHGSLGAQ